MCLLLTPADLGTSLKPWPLTSGLGASLDLDVKSLNCSVCCEQASLRKDPIRAILSRAASTETGANASTSRSPRAACSQSHSECSEENMAFFSMSPNVLWGAGGQTHFPSLPCVSPEVSILTAGNFWATFSEDPNLTSATLKGKHVSHPLRLQEGSAGTASFR